MREATWEECKETGAARLISPDQGKANALRRTANARIKFLSGIAIDEENANFIFEGLYASVVELLHAHLSMQGFNVANHICLGSTSGRCCNATISSVCSMIVDTSEMPRHTTAERWTSKLPRGAWARPGS